MSRSLRILFATLLVTIGTRPLGAQTRELSPSPTLPSDTLQANYAPRSEAAPMPELAPTLPSDTMPATEPVDSLPADSVGSSSSSHAPGSDSLFPDASPVSPGDSAALRELKRWIQRHPGLVTPPPVRAVLVRA